MYQRYLLYRDRMYNRGLHTRTPFNDLSVWCAFCIKIGHYFQIKKPSPRRFFYLVCIIFLVRPGLGRTFCSAKPKNDAHPASPICDRMPSPSGGFLNLICAVFPTRPGLNGRFASQNRKMTRTPLLRFATVCRLPREVFLI